MSESKIEVTADVEVLIDPDTLNVVLKLNRHPAGVVGAMTPAVALELAAALIEAAHDADTLAAMKREAAR